LRNNVFEQTAVDGHRYHDAWKTARNLVSSFLAKSLKLLPPAVRF